MSRTSEGLDERGIAKMTNLSVPDGSYECKSPQNDNEIASFRKYTDSRFVHIALYLIFYLDKPIMRVMCERDGEELAREFKKTAGHSPDNFELVRTHFALLERPPESLFELLQQIVLYGHGDVSS